MLKYRAIVAFALFQIAKATTHIGTKKIENTTVVDQDAKQDIQRAGIQNSRVEEPEMSEAPRYVITRESLLGQIFEPVGDALNYLAQQLGYTCSYVPRAEKLTVHLVHHTHDDIGWLHTIDEYFYGYEKEPQKRVGHIPVNQERTKVQAILDTTIRSLLQDPKKKFSYVEMKFFTMWWEDQTEAMKQDVRTLVSEGRLELLNAGWSMHDEACPHYEDLITNMQMGHDFVLKEFGVKPRIGWQIDAFGHSNANARLFAEMGFDAYFFVRMNKDEKLQRMEAKTMEWIQRPMWEASGDDAQIFTHAMYAHYNPPKGFLFDSRLSNGDRPFVTDESQLTYNAPQLSCDLYKHITEKLTNAYATNHIMIPMGEDFCFQNAPEFFASSDRLIDYWNTNIMSQTNIELKYSTPSMYIDDLAALDRSWTTRYDDMFPYADNDVTYWTGYYTSRANSKKFIRDGGHVLNSSNKLFALAALDVDTTDAEIQTYEDMKYKMMDAVGIAQHHDAITGTETTKVTKDYNNRIYEGMQYSKVGYSSLIADLAASAGVSSDQWQWCSRQNGTYTDCPIFNQQYGDMVVATHNPSNVAMETIQLLVPHSNYKVQMLDTSSASWVSTDANVVCNTQQVEFQPTQTETNCRMYVRQTINGGQVGLTKLIYDKSTNLEEDFCQTPTKQFIGNKDLTLEYLRSVDGILYFDLFDVNAGKREEFQMSLQYWESCQNQFLNSGAYVFRPSFDPLVFDPVLYSQVSSIESKQCRVKDQMTITFTGNNDQQGDAVVTIIIDDLGVVKYDVVMFGLPAAPIEHPKGHEVIVVFESSSIKNNQTFYTDSNGLDMQERILNYQASFNQTIVFNMNSTGNYYPIVTAIAIRDTKAKTQMTIMNDRAQGGSSLKEGRIEIMQNRRGFSDDTYGVGQWLNECNCEGVGITVPATYYMHFAFDTDKADASLQRVVQQRVDQPPQQFFSFDATIASASSMSPIVSSGFQAAYASAGVDERMKVETFINGKNSVLIRLENLNDLFDSNGQLIYKSVNLQTLAELLYMFANDNKVTSSDFSVAIEELSLTANQPIAEMTANKRRWKTVDDSSDVKRQSIVETDSVVQLQQQRIRVFRFNYTASKALFTQ